MSSATGETTACFAFGIIVGAFMGVIIGFPVCLNFNETTAMGIQQGVLQHQQTAIDAGHAEWIVNQKTGERAFKWKPTYEVEEFPAEEAPQ